MLYIYEGDKELDEMIEGWLIWEGILDYYQSQRFDVCGYRV